MNEQVIRKYVKYALVLADGSVLQEGDYRSPLEALADRYYGTHIEKRVYTREGKARGRVRRYRTAA